MSYIMFLYVSCHVYLLQIHKTMAPHKKQILPITHLESQKGWVCNKVPTGQANLLCMFHKTHNNVVYHIPPSLHKDQHRVDDRLKKQIFRESMRHKSSSSLMFEISQWEITMPVGPHFFVWYETISSLFLFQIGDVQQDSWSTVPGNKLIYTNYKLLVTVF